MHNHSKRFPQAICVLFELYNTFRLYNSLIFNLLNILDWLHVSHQQLKRVFLKATVGSYLQSMFGRKGTFYKPNKPLLYYISSQMHFKNCTQPHSCHLGEQEPYTFQQYYLIELNCFLLITCLCGSIVWGGFTTLI